jgi:thiamine biosynthesis protein ThiI
MAEDSAVTVPVLRPLVGMDKVEIIDMARDIGTYDISTMPGGCCTFMPEGPSTAATAIEVQRAEDEAGLERLVEKAMGGLRELRELRE